ncbi:transposase InsO family protein [Rhodanobacter sp. K2T2]|nr:transposase InsO family protein [Rhodanobacter sp. K2T2]
MNHKRVHRLNVQAGLHMRAKRQYRRKAAAMRPDRPVLTAPDQLWSTDFVSDTLLNGRRLRALTVVNNVTNECLVIEVAHHLRREDLVATHKVFAADGRYRRAYKLITTRIHIPNTGSFRL